MKRLICTAGLLVALSGTATAQFGRLGGAPARATNPRTAWGQLPPEQLACIEQALQRERSSLNDLIRQGVYPNSPQYGNILDKCERSLRPRIADASQPITDPSWASRSPEDQFAYFDEVFWFESYHDTGYKCQSTIGKSYADRKACLIANGIRYEATIPQRCILTITEYEPTIGQPARSWDGKVTGSSVIGRRITFPLSSLDESMIGGDGSIFRLDFEIKDRTSIIRSVAMSADPTAWIDLPSPPLATDVPSNIRTDKKRHDQLMQMQVAWASGLRRYGNVDVRGFEFAGSYNRSNSRNSDAEQAYDSQMRTFMKFGTAILGVAFWEAPSIEPIAAAFVKTVKSILSTCR
jgi:hypothetical protein